MFAANYLRSRTSKATAHLLRSDQLSLAQQVDRTADRLCQRKNSSTTQQLSAQVQRLSVDRVGNSE